MPDLASVIQAGAGNPWAYLPVAVLLGALHALEPGHSKSLMAAFIIAVKGTKVQAVVLGLAAALGHTAVVWLIAGIGLWLGDRMILDRAEPWLMLLSGLLILGLAFRIYRMSGGPLPGFGDREHGHDHHHGHDHDPEGAEAVDAHAAMHEREIAQRYAGRRDLSFFDIAWFGFTGGLLPCPAAIAVLLVSLQLGHIGLGITMVAAFSLGLAVTMVAVGVAAAMGAGALRSRVSGFDAWAARLPFVSAGIVALIGLIFTLRGVILILA